MNLQAHTQQRTTNEIMLVIFFLGRTRWLRNNSARGYELIRGHGDSRPGL